MNEIRWTCLPCDRHEAAGVQVMTLALIRDYLQAPGRQA